MTYETRIDELLYKIACVYADEVRYTYNIGNFKLNWKTFFNENKFETSIIETNNTNNAIVKYLAVMNVPLEEVCSMTYKEAVAYIYLFNNEE